MSLELLPVIDKMISFYEEPKSIERFHHYLQLLEGGCKGDVNFPISGFNPMAGEHVRERLLELKALGAEQIAQEVLTELKANRVVTSLNPSLQIALNLSDDLKGGWTNRFTSDYDSKFKFNGLFNRNFCVPIFWASELFTEEVIRVRVKEYIFRSIYWMKHPKPICLRDHVNQELFVAESVGALSKNSSIDFIELQQFYLEHLDSDNYHILFNFFYGEIASKSLEFPVYLKNEAHSGFEFVRWFIQQS